MNAIEKILSPITLPRMIPVRQHFKADAISDIRAAVRTELERQPLRTRIAPGARVAISAGSRGIANLPLIFSTIVDWVRDTGGEPFLVPAMGSHGGATADGQLEILRTLGITEETVGAPIHSSMDVVELDRTPQGWPVRIDRTAYEQADVIIPVGRIKPHTSFTGRFESGLVKMIAIGLGKQAGADICHAGGMGEVSQRIEAIAACALAKAPIIFGFGIIENAYDESYRFCAVPAEQILEQEPPLLELARSLMPQILIDRCDVLIVDEAGKNIAGTGMDPNIVRANYLDTVSYKPLAQRIALLDLTDVSHGNANGMNNADVCTRRFFNKIDFAETYPNPLTTGILQSSKVPLVMENDRLAIQAAIKGCFHIEHNNARLVRIKNTLSIEQIEVSENLREEVAGHPDLEILGAAAPFSFNPQGDLFESPLRG